MRQGHNTEPLKAIPHRTSHLKSGVLVREVPYEQCDRVQREAWDWLSQWLLGLISSRTQKKAPEVAKTSGANSACPAEHTSTVTGRAVNNRRYPHDTTLPITPAK